MDGASQSNLKKKSDFKKRFNLVKDDSVTLLCSPSKKAENESDKNHDTNESIVTIV